MTEEIKRIMRQLLDAPKPINFQLGNYEIEVNGVSSIDAGFPSFKITPMRNPNGQFFIHHRNYFFQFLEKSGLWNQFTLEAERLTLLIS